jgi:hypothetical protein
MTDPSLIDAFTARSLGVPMQEMLRTRRARTAPWRLTTRGGTSFVSPTRPLPGELR